MTLIDPDIRRLNLLVSDLQSNLGDLQGQVGVNGRNIQSLISTQASSPAAPVSNLLWNGELGHSVYTWNEIAGTPSGDKNEECAWFFSHGLPVMGPLAFTSGNVSAASDTITITAHGLTTGCPVDLTTAGTLPTGLAISTVYFVIVVDANTIKLATTVANAFSGTAIDITGVGAGSSTVQQILISTNAETSATNNELKTTAHSTYNAHFSRWNGDNGYGEMSGKTSIDALIPSNFIDATTPSAYISLIIAKKHRYINIPSTCLMAGGIWDNTSGQRCFLQSSVVFTATLSGTPGAVERRYRVHFTSDRGYSLLSSEITIANAPADGAFSATSNIILQWAGQAGQLQVDIYEYLPAGGDGVSAAQYRLIAEVSSGTDHIHLGGYLKTVLGYPTPTGTVLSATYFTNTGEITSLATDMISSRWDTISFPDAVPSNYNKGNTTDRQWARLWLTQELDLLIDSCTTDGTTTITAPAAAGTTPTAFPSEYGSLFAGKTAIVYDAAGAIITTTTVSSRTSDTALVLGAAVAAGSGRSLRIVGGGFHGILIDKVHLGFQRNVSYAPNSNDARTLQPRAAPSSSSQGTVGSGGDDSGGIDRCIYQRTPVQMAHGIWKEIINTNGGDPYASGGVAPNRLVSLRLGSASLRRVVSANGVVIEATDTERFVTSRDDTTRGTPLSNLRVGDPVLTEIDGRIVETTIAAISPYLRRDVVCTPILDGGHLFIAGEVKRLSWLVRLRCWIRLQRRPSKGGFVLHNEKRAPGDGFGVAF